jgi:hypothetical protein
MSQLSRFIRAELKRQKITAREFSMRAGLHESQISLVISGKRKSVETGTLAKMVRGISSDPTVQSGLIRAALADHNIALDPQFKSKVSTLPETTQRLLKKLMSGKISASNLRLLSDLADKLA